MSPQSVLQHHDSGQPWPDSVAASDFGDLAAAYRSALAQRTLRIARGEVPRGYKIGFTNRSIWPRYAVYAPIWGTVWDTSLIHCQGQAVLSLAGLCQPRIEPEAVFGLKAAPRPHSGLDGLYAALDWVAPGFEIVQSHRPGWRFTAPETVADGALHARLLVGPKQPVATLARDAASLQAALAAARLQLHRDGAAVEAGAGANVLDSPLLALLHFVEELRQCPGAPSLQAGDVVTTGTWTDAWPVSAGQTWLGQFSAPLTPLQVRFE